MDIKVQCKLQKSECTVLYVNTKYLLLFFTYVESQCSPSLEFQISEIYM
jgi:hypothetical protein